MGSERNEGEISRRRRLRCWCQSCATRKTSEGGGALGGGSGRKRKRKYTAARREEATPPRDREGNRCGGRPAAAGGLKIQFLFGSRQQHTGTWI